MRLLRASRAPENEGIWCDLMPVQARQPSTDIDNTILYGEPPHVLVVCNQQNQTIDSRIIPISIRNSLVMPYSIAYFRLLLLSSSLPVQPRFPSLSSSPEPPAFIFSSAGMQPALLERPRRIWRGASILNSSPPCCSCAVCASAAHQIPAQHPLRPLQQQSPLPKPAKAPP